MGHLDHRPSAKYIAVTLLKMAAACFVGAYSFYKLTIQAHLIPGGFSGIAAVVELATGGTVFGLPLLTAGVLGMLMNIPFFIMSYKTMNKQFFWFCLYGMIMWSIMLEVVRVTMPVGVLDINFDQHPHLAPLFYAILSGVVGGISGGYIVRLGYSTGGSELIAHLVNQRFAFIKIGTVINFIKFFVIALYATFIGTNPEMILLTLFAGMVSSAMVDRLVDGFKAAKAYYIISTKPTDLSAAIMHNLNRTSTLFSGEGQRLHTEQKMLMCIIYNNEVARLRAIVHRVDPKAFMFSTMVKEAYGTGFAPQKAPLKLFRTLTRNPESTTSGEPFTISQEVKNIAREIKIQANTAEQLTLIPYTPPAEPSPEKQENS